MSLARLPSLFAVASLATIAAPVVANIGVTTTVQRLATADGLTDNYVRGSVSFRSGATLLSATRPNGQTNWPQQFGSWQVTTPQGPGFMTGAQIDSWMDSNARGTFSATWRIDVGTSPGTYQSSMDTTPYYVAPTARTFLELTQASIAQFNDICANGRTGTFTFNTTQDIVQAGFFGVSLTLSGSNGAVFSPTVLSGNSFTVDIQSALSANTRLIIGANSREVAFQENTNYPFGGTARYNFAQETMYFAEPVPAPGALALLGVAGLARRRRRG